MGWKMPWYTMTDSFDTDFGVDRVARPQCIHSRRRQGVPHLLHQRRGDEAMGTTWSYLDMTALGRQETWEDSPEGYPQTPPYKWWNWHDNYDAESAPHPQWVDIMTDPEGAAFEDETQRRMRTAFWRTQRRRKSRSCRRATREIRALSIRCAPADAVLQFSEATGLKSENAFARSELLSRGACRARS